MWSTVECLPIVAPGPPFMLDLHLNAPLTLDPKGRITLPSRARAWLELAGINVLVGIAHRGHLRLYTKEAFRKHVAEPLVGRDSFDPAVERRQRLRLGFSAELMVDPQGRFVIPANFRTMAGLERDVVLMTVGERMEIWDAVRLDRWLLEAMAEESGGSGE